MIQKTEEAIRIAEQIQEDIIGSKVSILNILRKYYSLVTLIDIKDETEWAICELYGYGHISKIPDYRKVTDNKNKRRFAVIGNSCGIIERRFQNGKYFNYMCVHRRRVLGKTIKIRTGHYIAETIKVGPENFYRILNFVTNNIYSKTQAILLVIKFGEFEFDIFEETRKVVDPELSKRCPDTFKKLTEAYENSIKSESPLAFQQTAHACRVVIKDFADTIYPAGDKKTFIDLDGKSHPIKDDDYINRIIACIQENTDSKSNREFIKNSLIYLGNFLKSINDLTSIGTHHEISKEDANRCLIYTYLALGDVIKLLGKH